MELPKQQNYLLYQHEVLRAKLEIRDHYFNTIVRDIYENTGQTLSLVRIQLAVIGQKVTEKIKPDVSESGDLVGQTIHDLREMCKKFFPEIEILSESGLVDALKKELGIGKHDDSKHQVTVRGVPFALEPGGGMVFYLVILEIITYLAGAYGSDAIELEVVYTNTSLNICISYPGDIIDLPVSDRVSAEPGSIQLGIRERILLIGGDLVFKKKNENRSNIDISIPYTTYRAA